jgi:hypothetical protein
MATSRGSPSSFIHDFLVYWASVMITKPCSDAALMENVPALYQLHTAGAHGPKADRAVVIDGFALAK